MKSIRITHAHLDRRENGDIYAVFKLNRNNNSPKYEYCFIGQASGTLTYEGKVIETHPQFKNIEQFEDWCRTYSAEHDL